MGEAGPFVKEGWREDLIAASGAAVKAAFREWERAPSGRRTEPCVRLQSTASVPAAGAPGPAEGSLPAGSGTTSMKFLCTPRLHWIGGKAPIPKRISAQEQNY